MFKKIRVARSWQQIGEFREREIEQRSVCADCSKPRQTRIRKVVAIEREAAADQLPPLDPTIRDLAKKLSARFSGRQVVRAAPLVRDLGGIRSELELERLVKHAPLRLEYRVAGTRRHLFQLRLLDREALVELAYPGVRASRNLALTEARDVVAPLRNPDAQLIALILADEASRNLDQRVVRSLAALAQMAEDGEVKPMRVFSTEVLGDSKALMAIRPQLERLVGPLHPFGIRDLDTQVLVGGTGVLHLRRSDIDIGSLRQVGIAAKDLLEMKTIESPEHGILLVENLTPFHACLDQLADESLPLVVWSEGFLSRGVRSLVHQGASEGVTIRVWCDLDLSGVRIARTVHEIAPDLVEPVLMEPELLAEASICQPLPSSQAELIKRDLELHPKELLADTLRAIVKHDVWVEQESLIGRIPTISGLQSLAKPQSH